VVGRDQTEEFRVLVTLPGRDNLEKSTDVTFVATDLGLGERASAKDHFILP
jgi:hypothetical protein